MNGRRITAFVVVILLTVAFGYVAMGGVSWGIYEIRPFIEQIPKGLDLTGGVSVVYEAKDTSIPDLEEQMATVQTIMRTRLDSEGYPEATIIEQGSSRIRIEIPINESNAVEDPAEITQYLVSPAVIEFVDPDGTVLFDGSDMETVAAGINQNGQYSVNFELNAEATAAFAEATARLSLIDEATMGAEAKAISINMDGFLISSPIVSETIHTGEAEITGDFTAEEAQRLAQQIQSGALPIEMEEIEVRSVSATLGENALSTGLMAGAIGIALVFVFMIAYYRLPGVVACIALSIYILFLLLLLATIEGVQLTLPGIAGMILSIGMAVDANVIIFERMREEIIEGKTVRTAIKAGFSRAFSAILDSNVTTIIAALVLLFFGTGSIKGFAVTLLIGIILSFVTAVFVTRGLLYLMLGFNLKNKALLCPKKKLEAAKRK